MFKWRIYCTNEGDVGWQELWSVAKPTTCPNNVAHSVNPNSVQDIGQEIESVHLYKDKVVNTTSYMRVSKIKYHTSIQGTIRSVKLGIHSDTGVTSYDVQIFDQTNKTELIETTLTNTDIEDNIKTTGVIQSPPSDDFILEVNVKRNGGTGSIYVSEIIIMSEVDN